MRIAPVFVFVIMLLFCTTFAAAQAPTTLTSGFNQERTLGPGDSHVYTTLDPGARPGKYVMQIDRVVPPQENASRLAANNYPAALQAVVWQGPAGDRRPYADQVGMSSKWLRVGIGILKSVQAV